VMSSQAAARVLRERLGADAAILVTGSPALRAIIEAAGFRTVESADDRPDGVVQGFSFDVCYADLLETALAVRGGALWVATNVDSTLPSPRGLLPGNGSLVGMVAIATGARPVVAGKPALPLHAEAVERTGAKHPLVVGDRLDTDIEGANAAATDSLLVMTGVTTPAEFLAATPSQRPTYIAADLTGLLTPQPEVVPAGAQLSCAGWTGRIADGHLEISGRGDAIDGLRLLATLAWSADVAPDAQVALGHLGLR
jgi:glycerol 3-phosphatase-2